MDEPAAPYPDPRPVSLVGLQEDRTRGEPSKYYKYLIVWPFAPLTIAKAYLLIIYALAVVQWRRESTSTWIPVLNVLLGGLTLMSLWFTVQKCFIRKAELAMSSLGCLASVVGLVIMTAFSQARPFDEMAAQVCTTIGWAFCTFWTWRFTEDTISRKLFVPDWGAAVTNVEVEALADDF